MTKELKDLFQMIDDIPCTCHEAFKSRKREDPACPRCNWIHKPTVEAARKYLQEEKS